MDAILTSPPSNPGHLATKLLEAIIPQERLANSICTEAEGRETIPVEVLLGIKRKLPFYQVDFVYCKNNLNFVTVDHVNYIFPQIIYFHFPLLLSWRSNGRALLS